MLANIKNKIKTSSVIQKMSALLVFLFNFLHKKFMFGIFSKIDEKFFKFLFVGVINTMFSYFIYSLLIFLGIVANLALFFQYILGVLWNFKTTGVIVFKNHDNSLLFKFILSYVFTFSINSVLLFYLTKIFNEYLAQAILIMPIAMVSFLIFKFWVFKPKP